jgi:hypothetical protein
LHNTPAGQSKTKQGVNASQLTAVEEEYRAVVRHTLGILEKVRVCQRLSALDPHSMAHIYILLRFFYCAQVARLDSGNNSRPFVRIFMETTAQHFPNFEGDFFTEPLPSDDAARS